MKKFTLFLLFAVSFFSCTAPRYGVQSWQVDLTPYAREGFLVSTAGIGQPYESVALVFAQCRNGAVPVEKQKPAFDPVYASFSPGNYRRCTAAELVAELVTKSRSLGANALINLKIMENDNGLFAEALAVKLK